MNWPADPTTQMTVVAALVMTACLFVLTKSPEGSLALYPVVVLVSAVAIGLYAGSLVEVERRKRRELELVVLRMTQVRIIEGSVARPVP